MDAGSIAITAHTGAVRRPGWFAICLWLHRWTGLLALPFFLILCLTGSVLIFHQEVDVLLGAAPSIAEGGTPLPLGRLVDAAASSRPSLHPLFVSAPPESPDRIYVRLAKPGVTDYHDAEVAIIGRATGMPLSAAPLNSSFTGVLLTLHSEWFLKTPGSLFGGVIAILVLVCLVTGVVIHAPFVRRLAFGTVRRGRGTRIVQFDLHNLVGIIVLGWATLVTVSGIMLASDAVLLPVWRDTELREMMGKDVPVPEHPVSIDAVLAAAQRVVPDGVFHFAFFPGTEYSSPGHYMVAMYGSHRYDEQLFTVVAIDAATGQVADTRPVPFYLKAVLLSGPLHFGNYGGLPLKLLWLASTWGALFITGNGAWLWWRRRRGRRAAA